MPVPVPLDPMLATAVVNVQLTLEAKVAVMLKLLVTVTETGLDVLVTPPLQPLKVYPELGVAVSVSTEPVGYVPSELALLVELTATVPEPESVIVTAKLVCVKVAASVEEALSVKLCGFVEPVSAPEKLDKLQSVVGTAVAVMLVPHTYDVPETAAGLRVMEPEPVTLVVSVHIFCVKFATTVVFAVISTTYGLVVLSTLPLLSVKSENE